MCISEGSKGMTDSVSNQTTQSPVGSTDTLHKPIHYPAEGSHKPVFWLFIGPSERMICAFDSFKDRFSLLGCQFSTHRVKSCNGTPLIRSAVNQVQRCAGFQAFMGQGSLKQARPQSIGMPPTEFRCAIWIAENLRPTVIHFDFWIKALTSHIVCQSKEMIRASTCNRCRMSHRGHDVRQVDGDHTTFRTADHQSLRSVDTG